MAAARTAFERVAIANNSLGRVASASVFYCCTLLRDECDAFVGARTAGTDDDGGWVGGGPNLGNWFADH